MRKVVIGVMGPGAGATDKDLKRAFELGKLIAEQEWILLSGGRRQGVMDAANKGAKSANGLTIGILPSGDNDQTSEAVDIAIITSMGSARNNINVLSSDVVVACGMGAGTASEVALALKSKKQVVLLTEHHSGNKFFSELGKENVHISQSPAEAIEFCKAIIDGVSQ